jgi:hypothetical protein
MLLYNLTDAIIFRLFDINIAIDLHRIDIAKKIYKLRRDKISIDKSAYQNNLNLVKFLHNNTDAECTFWAMNYAAMAGNFTMVKWLYRFRPECYINTAYAYAKIEGQDEIAYWVLIHNVLQDYNIL